MHKKNELERQLNVLLGCFYIRAVHDLQIMKKMGLMDTDKDKDCMRKRNEINDMSFAYSYEDLRNQILQMKDNEKKLLVAMPVEATDRNYKLYKTIDPEDIYFLLEKKDGKTKGTLNKKSLKLLIDKHKKTTK